MEFKALDIIIRGGANYAPAICSLLLIFLCVLHRLTPKRKNSLGLLRLPPGPFAWPIIGNLNQIKKLPHRDLDELGKKYGPIMMLKLGSVPTVVVSSSAMAKEFLKTHDAIFASRPLIAAGKYIGYNFHDVIFTPYGPYWRHMRKLCVVEVLNAKRIESFSCVREEEMISAVRSVWEISEQGKKAVNITHIFESFAVGVMWRIISGTKLSSQSAVVVKEVKKLAVEITEAAGLINIGDFIPFLDWMDLQGVKRHLEKVHNSFSHLIEKMIDEHQQRRMMNLHEETKGIVDVLLEHSLDGRPITRQNIEAIVLDMFIAGIETTSTTLDWAMSALLGNPNVVKKMREEIESVVGKEGSVVNEHDVVKMEYVQCVVKETLRLYPVLPLSLPHESTQDCIVGGYFIPKKTRLVVNAWAIGKDPSLWEDPLEFKPERFISKNVDVVRDKEYFDMLPFGAGRRGCPGAALAVVIMNLVLAQLFHCFEWSVDGEIDMMERFGTATPRRTQLLARPALRLYTCP